MHGGVSFDSQSSILPDKSCLASFQPLPPAPAPPMYLPLLPDAICDNTGGAPSQRKDPGLRVRTGVESEILCSGALGPATDSLECTLHSLLGKAINNRVNIDT